MSTPVSPFRALTSHLLAINAGGAGAGAGCMYPCVVIGANLRVYPFAPAARNLGTRSQSNKAGKGWRKGVALVIPIVAAKHGECSESSE